MIAAAARRAIREALLLMPLQIDLSFQYFTCQEAGAASTGRRPKRQSTGGAPSHAHALAAVVGAGQAGLTLGELAHVVAAGAAAGEAAGLLHLPHAGLVPADGAAVRVDV